MARGQLFLGGGDFCFGRRLFRASGGEVGFGDVWTVIGLPGFDRQFNRFHGELGEAQHGGKFGGQNAGFVGILLLAADEQVRGRFGPAIEGSRNAIPLQVGFTWDHVHANVVRFKKRPHSVVIRMVDRVVFVVVAFGAVERQSEKRLADVFDRVLHPLVAIEEEVVAGQVTGGTQLPEIVRGELVGGEHQSDHFIVGRVGIERFDDPVAPMPDVLLAISQLLA